MHTTVGLKMLREESASVIMNTLEDNTNLRYILHVVDECVTITPDGSCLCEAVDVIRVETYLCFGCKCNVSDFIISV